jgi:hypothetical protein
MMAITTSNSMSVKPWRGRGSEGIDDSSAERGRASGQQERFSSVPPALDGRSTIVFTVVSIVQYGDGSDKDNSTESVASGAA